jgi:hypothetical protein
MVINDATTYCHNKAVPFGTYFSIVRLIKSAQYNPSEREIMLTIRDKAIPL